MSIITYFKEIKAEMNHVTWPKTEMVFLYTVVIIIACAVLAIYLGFFDYIFNDLIQRIIQL